MRKDCEATLSLNCAILYDEMPPLVVAAIATVAVLSALFSVLWLLVRGAFRDLVQYRVVISLLSFALSTISCTLFVTASAKIDLNVPGLVAITLAGPAVVWLAVILALTYVWKEPEGLSNRSVPPGWIPFSRWRFQHAALNYLFSGEMLQYCIKEVFNNVFFRYPEKPKLSRPQVQTVFVYYERPDGCSPGMVKFQRVNGSSDFPVDLYHVSAPSLPGQDPSSFLFVKNGNSISRALARGRGDETWHHVEAVEIDSLVVAHCPEGNPREGDYLWVDVPKYTCDDATVNITFLSRIAMADDGDSESRLWEVTHSPPYFEEEGGQKVDVPVAFFKRKAKCVRRRAATEPFPLSEMSAWMRSLDSFITVPPRTEDFKAAHSFLQSIRSTLRTAAGAPDAGFANMFTGEMFPNACQFSVERIKNPVMAFIHWQQ